MLNNSSNMTSQSIFIDNFTQKQNFCYSLLYFKNIEGITNQGQILDYYFPEKNFLLLPRNIITKNNIYIIVFLFLFFIYSISYSLNSFYNITI